MLTKYIVVIEVSLHRFKLNGDFYWEQFQEQFKNNFWKE